MPEVALKIDSMTSDEGFVERNEAEICLGTYFLKCVKDKAWKALQVVIDAHKYALTTHQTTEEDLAVWLEGIREEKTEHRQKLLDVPSRVTTTTAFGIACLGSKVVKGKISDILIESESGGTNIRSYGKAFSDFSARCQRNDQSTLRVLGELEQRSTPVLA